VISLETVQMAMVMAARNHQKKQAVIDMQENWDEVSEIILKMIENGEYKELICYEKKTLYDKKERHIDMPTLMTRILQYVFMLYAEPFYKREDPKISYNCKEGYGLNAQDRSKSVTRKVKHLFYDRRDLNYVLMIDQRHCYQHCTSKVFRRKAKILGLKKEWIDFCIDVCFVGKALPIGTPSSPLLQHIIMLEFDKWLKRETSISVRYADNVLVGCEDKQSAQRLKWRIMNHWWYDLQIRANRKEVSIKPIKDSYIDFCGYVFHRNEGKRYNEHNKGYTLARRSTAENARKATSENWGCYFGLLRGGDTYHLMKKIEEKMKLQDLTSRIRINRKLDAPNIQMKDIDGVDICILDYEMRTNKLGQVNWVKLLLMVKEKDIIKEAEGEKILIREVHGDYKGIYSYLLECEKEYKKEDILPLTNVRITNQCGYIFEGSTNQVKTLEDYKKQVNNSINN